MKINLFLSYKERAKHNVVAFSKILPNNQISTARRIKLRVQEMTMNEKLTMIGLTFLSKLGVTGILYLTTTLHLGEVYDN